jgi:phospholipase D1/2
MRSRVALAVAALAAAAIAATLAWRFTPLHEMLSAERIVEWIETFANYWWAPFAVALLYTPGSLVLLPRPLLTMAAAIAFGPWKGFAVAMGGIVLNALVGYALGRALDEKFVRRFGGNRYDRIGSMMRKEGFMAVTMIGLLPVAPFFAEVLAFGTLRIPVHQVVAGVFVANLPGTIGSTLLGDQVAAALSQHRNLNTWVIAAVVVAMAAIAWGTRHWWKRLQQAATG